MKEKYTPKQWKEWKKLWKEAGEVAYSQEEKQQLMLIQAARIFRDEINKELLECLEAVLNIDNSNTSIEAIEKREAIYFNSRRAIAKATGGAP